jgi:hypothetical protein
VEEKSCSLGLKEKKGALIKGRHWGCSASVNSNLVIVWGEVIAMYICLFWMREREREFMAVPCIWAWLIWNST